jgi:hypothetical protein
MTTGTAAVMDKLRKLSRDRYHKIEQVNEALLAAGTGAGAGAGGAAVSHARSEELKRAKECVDWVLAELPEDQEATTLHKEVMRREEELSEAAMSALLAGDDGGGGGVATGAIENNPKKKKKKKGKGKAAQQQQQQKEEDEEEKQVEDHDCHDFDDISKPMPALAEQARKDAEEQARRVAEEQQLWKEAEKVKIGKENQAKKEEAEREKTQAEEDARRQADDQARRAKWKEEQQEKQDVQREKQQQMAQMMKEQAKERQVQQAQQQEEAVLMQQQVEAQQQRMQHKMMEEAKQQHQMQQQPPVENGGGGGGGGGVSWDEAKGMFHAELSFGGKVHSLGHYIEEERAKQVFEDAYKVAQAQQQLMSNQHQQQQQMQQHELVAQQQMQQLQQMQQQKVSAPPGLSLPAPPGLSLPQSPSRSPSQAAEKDAKIVRLEADNARLCADNARLTESNERRGLNFARLHASYEDIQAKFELLEQMYQPVQTENEQRKEMMADMRKTALEISRSRQDLDLPTKRMGELDFGKLSVLSVAPEDISLLQGVVCDPNFHPWHVKQLEGSEEVETVVNWANPQLAAMVLKYDASSGGKGRQVVEEVLRCNKELQGWNSSGGYCVTIPYHHGERREMRPCELLKLAVGIDIPGCHATAGDAGEQIVFTGGRGGHVQPPQPPGLPTSPAGASATPWSRVIGRRR